MPSRKHESNLVWLDLETTGIDVGCRILEVAVIVTDKDLQTLVEGPDFVIGQPQHVLERMDAWCIEQHADSGLTAAVCTSQTTLEEAEKRILEVIATYCPPGACPLCGNSICFDRRFLIRHMPALNAHLSYRNIDVSAIKELVSRWYGPEARAKEKQSRHRALSDIRESIDELRHYRDNVFRRPQ